MNSMHAHFNILAGEIGAKLKLHGSVCPLFWILTVEWSGARSCRQRFQIASFSPSTLENSVFKKHSFQIAPLCRAFSNGSVFGDRFRSVDDRLIRSKPVPFSFENGLVWTGPESTWTHAKHGCFLKENAEACKGSGLAVYDSVVGKARSDDVKRVLTRPGHKEYYLGMHLWFKFLMGNHPHGILQGNQ